MIGVFGKVTQVNYKKALCKVALRDERTHNAGERFETGWLPVAAMRAKEAMMYALPAKGETVYCLLNDNRADGIVLCSVFTADDAPKESVGMEKGGTVIHFKDGTTIKHRSDMLEIEASGDVDVKVKGDMNINVNGNVEIWADGDATVEAVGSMDVSGLDVTITATNATIDADVANITAKTGKASLLDTLTGLPFHLFVPG